jgi:hypothetical protein
MTNTTDQIRVESSGIVLVRQTTETGEYHRMSFCPEDDVSTQSQEIQDACRGAWTEEVIAAYRTMLAAQRKIT